MTDIEYSYHVRDKDLNILDDLDAWISMNGVFRFNNVSTLELELARSMPGVNLLAIDGGIVIKRDGVTIFSGSVTSREKTAHTIQYALESDNRHLRDSAGRPNPEQDVAPFTDDYYVLTSDYASTAMIDLVSKNIGPLSGSSGWRIPNLVMGVDPLLGYEFTMRANLDPLITLLKYAAASYQAGGLYFRILQSDTLPNTLELIITQCRDRTNEAVFSVDSSTASDYNDTYETGGPNYFYILGGDGFGRNRIIREGGDFAAIQACGRRIVQVVDARGTTSPAELEQKLAEMLATVSNSRRVTITPQEVPSLVYGQEYDLGDIVTVVIDGESFIEVVREVQLSFSPNEGPRVIPTINGSGTSADDGSEEGLVAQHVISLQERLGNIERNYNVPNNSIINDMLHPTVKEWLGDVKPAMRTSDHGAWLLMDGRALDKTIYSDLYGHFVDQGLDFGSAPTTFNLPNMEDKYPIGAGLIGQLGESGGSNGGNVELPAHSHTHSHGGGTLVWTHTHLGGDHDHNHDHDIAEHKHLTNIDHNHTSFNSGDRNNTTPGGPLRWEEPNVSSGTEDHHHAVDVPALGTTDVNSSNSIKSSGGGSLITTGMDATNGGVVATGQPQVGASWTGGTDPDSTDSTAVEANIEIQPPYLAMNWFIYSGVLS